MTVLDGSTSVIPPQGIDFLTHYINPFTKMVGSTNGISGAPPQLGTGGNSSIAQILPTAAKKQRRRSSNGSSSSLLFREEGRAIKTAGLVVFSFILNWTPYFTFLLLSQIEVIQTQLGDLVLGTSWGSSINASATVPTNVQPDEVVGVDWARFCGVFGILLSCLLNPFIYVFRNKMACKEVSKLLCRFFWEKRRQAKADAVAKERTQQLIHHNSRDRSDSTPSAAGSHEGPPIDYDAPKFTPCIGKSPKRSSLKSLTPQSSINSTNTTVNSPVNATSPMSSTMISAKPPFIRSMTVPEQTQPRVKFPPNLIRQKSCVHRPVYGGPTELTPALSKRSKFVRQDSICSILSNDSVLMICAEDNLSGSAESGLLSRSGRKSGSIGADGGMRCNGAGGSLSGGTPLALQKNYLRQDSNFSDSSHRTNDSGVVLSMSSTSAKPSANNSPCLPLRQLSSPSRLAPMHHIKSSENHHGLQTTI